MGKLVDIPLDKKLFKNVDEGCLTSTFAALENCFVTEPGGLSRFPGLKLFCDLGGNAEIHMHHYENDLMAVGTDGRTFRLDQNANSTVISGPPVLGGQRVSFSTTQDGLMMAAGAQIVKYDGLKNDILSRDAPKSSFVGYLDGYVLAVERDSNRFQHSSLNSFGVWDGGNTFSVNGSPDNINAMLITPYNEIQFSGEESIEQYERYVGGEVPFFRRWSVGEGISEPWTFCYMDNASWGLNSRREFVRLSGQTTQSVSDDLQKDVEYRYSLANIGALDKAWASGVYIKGQKFIVLQIPEATNSYGTKGITYVFDVRRGYWFEIFGWNASLGAPDLWPGRSVFSLWGKTFIGGNGKIYELAPDTYANHNTIQRAYVRTAHYDNLGTIRIDKIIMTLKRGVGSHTVNPKLMFRAKPDNRGWNNMQFRELGYAGSSDFTIEFGAQGTGTTWQFEWSVTDDCPFELRRMQAEVTSVPR